MDRLVVAHDRFLAALAQGAVLVREIDADELVGELDEEALKLIAAEGRAVDAALYDVDRLTKAVRSDRALLADLADRASKVTAQQDPKLRRLLDLLRETGAAEGDARKVVLFSYFSDTIDYIKSFLDTLGGDVLGPYNGRYVDATGAGSSDQRRKVVWSFVPKSAEAPPGSPDANDLLLATDALAEGQNLQQAARMVNFDLPWNPMRIVQRNGRIDRIGSEHSTVTLYTFFPEKELDDLLHLERLIREKLLRANAAVGVENPPIPGATATDQNFADAEEAIRGIAAEDESVLEKQEAKVDAFSGELLREELRRALAAGRGPELERLPWGAGSGHARAGRRTVVFAARAGAERVWRGVPIDDGTVLDDWLQLLGDIRCGPETVRHLPDAVRGRLFDLWTWARAEIFDAQIAALDPKNRQAAVPRAQIDAVTLLQSVRLQGAPDAVRALQVPWPRTVARSLRRLLNALGRDGADADAVARQIIELVRDEGLRPPASRAAPTRITIEDIHLVCFQVVTN